MAPPDSNRPIAVVTGANRGIGLAVCRRLRDAGREVIAVCRRSSRGLDGLGVRVEGGVDVTSDDAVAGLARRLGGIALAELVSNAGILRDDSLDNLYLDDVREQLEVNALGHLRLVRALRPNLGKGSKIALITSRMGSIGDNGSGGTYGYRMSKAALNMAGVSLAHDLKSAGIAVAIIHPGFVRTDMTENTGNLDPDESAKQLLDRLDALTLDSSGTFWHVNGQTLPW
jgi:NAD(P)-dependent dehydrogenase (short-subunit alcohol dehydrogenase family)